MRRQHQSAKVSSIASLFGAPDSEGRSEAKNLPGKGETIYLKISIDYDGCCMFFRYIFDRKGNYLKTKKLTHDLFCQWVVDEVGCLQKEGYFVAGIELISGSARQSRPMDYFNAMRNKNGSAFIGLDTMLKALRDYLEEQGIMIAITRDRFVLEDYQEGDNKETNQETRKLYVDEEKWNHYGLAYSREFDREYKNMSAHCEESSKLLMVYVQQHRCVADNHKLWMYYLVDDRLDILKNLHGLLKAHRSLVPKNILRTNFCQYGGPRMYRQKNDGGDVVYSYSKPTIRAVIRQGEGEYNSSHQQQVLRLAKKLKASSSVGVVNILKCSQQLEMFHEEFSELSSSVSRCCSIL